MHVVVLHVAGDNRQETGKQPQKRLFSFGKSRSTRPQSKKLRTVEKEKRPPIGLVGRRRGFAKEENEQEASS